MTDRTQEVLVHGTVVEFDGERPVRWTDRRGTVALAASWHEAALHELRVRIPDGRELAVAPRAVEHPILGPCDGVGLPDRPPLALFTGVDWAAPRALPALDRPGALPSGGGTAVLNAIAFQARRAGRTALRYTGPYPTGALFDALTECFRPAGDLVAAFRAFTARVEETAMTAEVSEVPVDFAPAPFERVWFDGGVCVQLRDGVERAYLHGRAYARDAAGARRVRRREDGYAAVVELAGEPWAEVARFDARGDLVDGPHPLPPVDNKAVGLPLSDAIRATLIHGLLPRAPALLQPTLHRVLGEVPMHWGNPGADLSAIEGGGIVLHAALPERLRGHTLEELFAAIAEAVEPAAHRLAQQRLAEAAERREG